MIAEHHHLSINGRTGGSEGVEPAAVDGIADERCIGVGTCSPSPADHWADREAAFGK